MLENNTRGCERRPRRWRIQIAFLGLRCLGEFFFPSLSTKGLLNPLLHEAVCQPADVKIRERPRGMIQLVLTLLAFGLRVLLVPRLPASSGSFRVCPRTRICFMALGHLLCSSAAHNNSLPPVQKRDAQHKLLQHKGAHTDKKNLGRLGDATTALTVFAAFRECQTSKLKYKIDCRGMEGGVREKSFFFRHWNL